LKNHWAVADDVEEERAKAVDKAAQSSGIFWFTTRDLREGKILSMSETMSGVRTGDKRLCRNALSLSHCVSTTLASIAPALSFFFGFAVIVAGAGLAAPMTILTAMVGILFLTNTVAQFSRFTPSSGSFVTFTGKAFGPA
jgi:hypothetical protein